MVFTLTCFLGFCSNFFYTNSTIASEECEFISVLAIANCYVNMSRFSYYKSWYPDIVTRVSFYFKYPCLATYLKHVGRISSMRYYPMVQVPQLMASLSTFNIILIKTSLKLPVRKRMWFLRWLPFKILTIKNFRNQSSLEILSKMYSYFFRVFKPNSMNMNGLPTVSIKIWVFVEENFNSIGF